VQKLPLLQQQQLQQQQEQQCEPGALGAASPQAACKCPCRQLATSPPLGWPTPAARIKATCTFLVGAQVRGWAGLWGVAFALEGLHTEEGRGSTGGRGGLPQQRRMLTMERLGLMIWVPCSLPTLPTHAWWCRRQGDGTIGLWTVQLSHSPTLPTHAWWCRRQGDGRGRAGGPLQVGMGSPLGPLLGRGGGHAWLVRCCARSCGWHPRRPSRPNSTCPYYKRAHCARAQVWHPGWQVGTARGCRPHAPAALLPHRLHCRWQDVREWLCQGGPHACCRCAARVRLHLVGKNKRLCCCLDKAKIFWPCARRSSAAVGWAGGWTTCGATTLRWGAGQGQAMRWPGLRAQRRNVHSIAQRSCVYQWDAALLVHDIAQYSARASAAALGVHSRRTAWSAEQPTTLWALLIPHHLQPLRSPRVQLPKPPSTCTDCCRRRLGTRCPPWTKSRGEGAAASFQALMAARSGLWAVSGERGGERGVCTIVCGCWPGLPHHATSA